MKTQKQKDMLFDSYIRKNIKSDCPDYPIEPTDGFTHNVMTGVISCEKFRAKCISLSLVALAIMPFAIRGVWSLVRNDYFSLSTLPFHGVLYNAYHMFMSPITFYVFLGAGIVMTTFIWAKRWKTMEAKIRTI
ncbi:MAG: hypothetical protein ABH833_00075 [Parcubacteria group bacterium]